MSQVQREFRRAWSLILTRIRCHKCLPSWDKPQPWAAQPYPKAGRLCRQLPHISHTSVGQDGSRILLQMVAAHLAADAFHAQTKTQLCLSSVLSLSNA